MKIFSNKKRKWGIYFNVKELLESNNLKFDEKFYSDCEVFTKLLQQWEVFII